MWPAEGPKFSIEIWPAKLRSAARATRGPHLCCGPRAACCGPRAALKNVKNYYMHPPHSPGGGEQGFHRRGGSTSRGKNFRFAPPLPDHEFRTKGKKGRAEQLRGCDAGCGPPGFVRVKIWPAKKKVLTPLL